MCLWKKSETHTMPIQQQQKQQQILKNKKLQLEIIFVTPVFLESA